MTSRRLALVVIAVAAAASVYVPSGSSTLVTRAVLVAITGQGKVTSLPRGITCPRTCFKRFPRDILMRLNARPASGWRLAGWSGYCHGAKCAFHLTTPHDCSGQLCSVGVFGTRVRFVKQ